MGNEATTQTTTAPDTTSTTEQTTTQDTNQNSQDTTTQASSSESNPINDALNTEGEDNGNRNSDGEKSGNSAADVNNDSADSNGARGEGSNSGSDNTNDDGTDSTDSAYEIEFDESSPLTDDQIDKIVAMAEENKWSKDQAEQYVKGVEEHYSAGVEAANKPRVEYYNEQKSLFDKDPAFTGENKEATYLSIKKAVKAFGDEDLGKQLSRPEVGNNYALAKFLAKVGSAMENGFETPEGRGNGNEGNGDNDHTKMLKNLYPAMFGEKSS
jgi:hypothetical protein